MKIDELEFSARTHNCLKRGKIDTVELLSKMSDDDLLRIRSFGQKCLAEVREKVAQPGKTNAELIRTMNDDDLRNFLCGLMTCDRCNFGASDGCKLKDWLQRPADEVHHGK